jgi:hypothetical protein
VGRAPRLGLAVNDVEAAGQDAQGQVATLVARHMRIGWAALLVFLSLGIGLELLHAYKAPLYLNPDQETRRLLWTLAHAHGVGLSLVNMGYAATLQLVLRQRTRALELASSLCGWSTLLVPLGFFLGGIKTYGGDPGAGVLLVPLGAALLWIAVVLVTRAVFLARR